MPYIIEDEAVGFLMQIFHQSSMPALQALQLNDKFNQQIYAVPKTQQKALEALKKESEPGAPKAKASGKKPQDRQKKKS